MFFSSSCVKSVAWVGPKPQVFTNLPNETSYAPLVSLQRSIAKFKTRINPLDTRDHSKRSFLFVKHYKNHYKKQHKILIKDIL